VFLAAILLANVYSGKVKKLAKCNVILNSMPGQKAGRCGPKFNNTVCSSGYCSSSAWCGFSDAYKTGRYYGGKYDRCRANLACFSKVTKKSVAKSMVALKKSFKVTSNIVKKQLKVALKKNNKKCIAKAKKTLVAITKASKKVKLHMILMKKKVFRAKKIALKVKMAKKNAPKTKRKGPALKNVRRPIRRVKFNIAKKALKLAKKSVK